MKVLVADDDDATLEMLRGLLDEWAYESVLARNGTEAWEILQREDAPPLVVTDWQMPGLNGEDLCRRARSLLADQPIHILLLTAAKVTVPDKVSGMGAGADDYLVKPFDVTELRARLKVGERLVNLQVELRNRIRELENAMAQIKQLHGLLPICVDCKRIRDDRNYWHQVESYVSAHTDAEFTHSVCPRCFEDRVQKMPP